MTIEALSNTKKIHIINRKEYPFVISKKHTDSTEAFSNNNFKSYENICLGLIGHHVFRFWISDYRN